MRRFLDVATVREGWLHLAGLNMSEDQYGAESVEGCNKLVSNHSGSLPDGSLAYLAGLFQRFQLGQVHEGLDVANRVPNLTCFDVKCFVGLVRIVYELESGGYRGVRATTGGHKGDTFGQALFVTPLGAQLQCHDLFGCYASFPALIYI